MGGWKLSKKCVVIGLRGVKGGKGGLEGRFSLYFGNEAGKRHKNRNVVWETAGKGGLGYPGQKEDGRVTEWLGGEGLRRKKKKTRGSGKGVGDNSQRSGKGLVGQWDGKWRVEESRSRWISTLGRG